MLLIRIKSKIPSDAMSQMLTLPECWGRTPLHLAVKGGFLDCVKLLIEAGADTNVKDEKGITPVLLAGAGVQLDNTNAIER
uniref:Ankyrin repeat protein n=1 Tax=Timema tahoe TaxID=61484 RepID=A0A7R9ITE4_9NEOP|nr:unnamed protein product [Timema tahoe]